MFDWRKEAQERVKEKSAGDTLSLGEGLNSVRVLPDKRDIMPDGKLNPKGTQYPPYREFRIHEKVGPDGFMSACGKNIRGEGKCWLCDKKIPALLASKNEAHRLRAAAMAPKEKFIVQASVFDTNTQKFSGPKKFWVSTGNGTPGKNQGQSLAVRVYSRISSTRKDFIDPIKGFNINITRTGTGIKTRYPEIEGDETATRVPSSVLLKIADLDTLFPQYDEQEQIDQYNGEKRRNNDSEDRPRGNSRPPARTSRRDVEEEQPEDEDQPEEQDEQDEQDDDTEEIGDEGVDNSDVEDEPEDEDQPEDTEDEPEGDEPEGQDEPEDVEEPEDEPEEEPEPPRRTKPTAKPPVKPAGKPTAKPVAGKKPGKPGRK